MDAMMLQTYDVSAWLISSLFVSVLLWTCQEVSSHVSRNMLQAIGPVVSRLGRYSPTEQVPCKSCSVTTMRHDTTR
jgi:hypothetical protein